MVGTECFFYFHIKEANAMKRTSYAGILSEADLGLRYLNTIFQ